jgi:hypothetical protein
MLDRKPDNITKVMLYNHDNTINQSVTPEVMSITDHGEWKMSVISRNYLITGSPFASLRGNAALSGCACPPLRSGRTRHRSRMPLRGTAQRRINAY